jgi:hypothetical protein
MGGRKLPAFIAVALFHVGVLYFLGGNLRVEYLPTPPEKVSQLVYWEFSPPKPNTNQQPRERRDSNKQTDLQAKKDVTAAPMPDADDQVIEASPSDTAISVTDFEAAKEVALQLALAKQEAEGNQRTFSATDRASIPMPERIERSPIKWDPLHGKKAGFSDQGVPFVKLSEKCVIVVLFPVCVFGGKIVYDGTLFEDLDNKLDRARENELP